MSFPKRRLRRLRQNKTWRRAVREASLSANDFIQPLFVIEGENIRSPVASMPGIFQLSIDNIVEEAKEINNLGIPAVILFGIPNKEQKDAQGSAGFDPEGIIPRAIRAIKVAVPELLVWADVCLCEYTDHGHCGVLTKDGNIDNDSSLELLTRTAVIYAQAGADALAPSDMMDGRVGAIRTALDVAGLSDTVIVSYAAKYASTYYGPFRDAVHSSLSNGDRRSYQMDPFNSDEALREVELDIDEGADIVMVKPAGPYMDVIFQVKEVFAMPTAAYQVSGEYAIIKAAAEQGLVDEGEIAIESLLGLKRAGADLIITYFAKDVAESLKEEA